MLTPNNVIRFVVAAGLMYGGLHIIRQLLYMESTAFAVGQSLSVMLASLLYYFILGLYVPRIMALRRLFYAKPGWVWNGGLVVGALIQLIQSFWLLIGGS